MEDNKYSVSFVALTGVNHSEKCFFFFFLFTSSFCSKLDVTLRGVTCSAVSMRGDVSSQSQKGWTKGRRKVVLLPSILRTCALHLFRDGSTLTFQLLATPATKSPSSSH